MVVHAWDWRSSDRKAAQVNQAVKDDAGGPTEIIGGLCESADAVAMFVADSKTLGEALRDRVADLGRRNEAAEAKAAQFDALLKSFQKMHVERDRLLEEVKNLTRRANTAAAESGVARAATEELKIAKRRIDSLTAALAAERAAATPDGLATRAKEAVQAACSKICDDFANDLSRLGGDLRHAQAEDFRKAASRIRALKL